MADCSVCVQWQIDLIPASMVLFAALLKNTTAVFIAKHCRVRHSINHWQLKGPEAILELLYLVCGYLPKWNHHPKVFISNDMGLNTTPIVIILTFDRYTCSQNGQKGQNEPVFPTRFQVPLGLFWVPYVTASLSFAIKTSMKMEPIQLNDCTI